MNKALSLVALGVLIFCIVGCSNSPTAQSGTFSISGTLNNALQSSISITFQTHSASIADVTVTAYSDPSHSNVVKSTSVSCATLLGSGNVAYTLSGLVKGTYYLNATQAITYSSSGISVTVYNSGTAADTVDSADLTGKNIDLAVRALP